MVKAPQRYYTYAPLPEGSIRLLKILHTNLPQRQYATDGYDSSYEWEKQLIISLETFELSSHPPYTALSYTWGLSGASCDPDPEADTFTRVERCFPILCDGFILLATFNLRAALRRLRYCFEQTKHLVGNEDGKVDFQINMFQKVQYLWVDALCINQNDLQERSRQVILMSRIYKQAHRTFAWLGEEDQHTDEAISCLRKAVDNCEKGYNEYRQSDASKAEHQAVNLADRQKLACIALFTRSWFSRYWIIQEALLSKELLFIIGAYVCPFVMFAMAVAIDQIYGFRAPPYGDMRLVKRHSQAHINIVRLRYMNDCRDQISNGTLPDIMHIMSLCGTQQCNDPRDRIFSLLGVTSEFTNESGTQIQPDYSKSAEDVFLQGTIHFTQKRMDLALLNLVHGKRQHSNLPTWCPNYAPLASAILVGPRKDSISWRLSHCPSPSMRIVGCQLTAYGQCIGNVQETVAVMLRGMQFFGEGKGRLDFGFPQILGLLSRINVDGPVRMYNHILLGQKHC